MRILIAVFEHQYKVTVQSIIIVNYNRINNYKIYLNVIHEGLISLSIPSSLSLSDEDTKVNLSDTMNQMITLRPCSEELYILTFKIYDNEGICFSKQHL